MTDKPLPMPRDGGSYRRNPDGSLTRIDTPSEPATDTTVSGNPNAPAANITARPKSRKE